MSSLLGFVIGVVVGPVVWLIGFVVIDFVISSYEYARVKREAITSHMKDTLRDLGILK